MYGVGSWSSSLTIGMSSSGCSSSSLSLPIAAPPRKISLPARSEFRDQLSRGIKNVYHVVTCIPPLIWRDDLQRVSTHGAQMAIYAACVGKGACFARPVSAQTCWQIPRTGCKPKNSLQLSAQLARSRSEIFPSPAKCAPPKMVLPVLRSNRRTTGRIERFTATQHRARHSRLISSRLRSVHVCQSLHCVHGLRYTRVSPRLSGTNIPSSTSTLGPAGRIQHLAHATGR